MNPDRLYDRNFAIAFASQILFVLAGSLLAHYARWISFLGGDERHVGWIMGVAPVISLFFRPWVGPWIDRLGVRGAWAAGQALVFVVLPLNLVFDELGVGLFVLRMLTTLGMAVTFASSLTYVTLVAPPTRRTEAIGVFGAAGFAGMLFGPALGDLLLGGDVRRLVDFVAYFAVMAAAVALSSLLLSFVRSIPTNTQSQRVRVRDFLVTARKHWPGAILFVHVMFGVCMTVPFGFLAKFADDVDLARHGVGPFFMLYAGWGLTLRIVLRDWPDRLGRSLFLMIGMLTFAAGTLSFLWVDADHAWRLALPALLCGTGHSLSFHTMVSLAIERFPPESRGTGSVIALSHLDLGQIVGAPVLGQVAYHFGYAWLFVAVAGGCILAVVYYTFAYIQARTQE